MGRLLNAVSGAMRALLPSRSKAVAATGQVLWPGQGWFQQGITEPNQILAKAPMSFSAVYSCVSILSGDVAKIPIHVYRNLPAGGKERISSKERPRSGWLAYVLERPNYYQSRLEAMIQVMTSLLYRGNAYIFVEYNAQNQPVALYPMYPDRVAPWVSPDGEVFYAVNQDPMHLEAVRSGPLVPARYMIHLRLITLTHPLIGVTPLYAAAYSTTAGIEILRQSQSFFKRMARPSGVLTNPRVLDDSVVERLRNQWREYYGGDNAGETAVLEQGTDWKPLTMSAVDAQLIDQLRFTIEDVARVYRVPQFLLGDLSKVSYRNAETLMRSYYQGALSYYLEAIEERLDHFFDLKPDLFVEFDLTELLKTEFDTRMEGYAKAIQGGVYTPNEARAKEGLNPKKGGDKLFLQAQMTPIDLLGTPPTPPPEPAPTPPPAEDGEDVAGGEDAADGEDALEEAARAEVRRAINRRRRRLL